MNKPQGSQFFEFIKIFIIQVVIKINQLREADLILQRGSGEYAEGDKKLLLENCRLRIFRSNAGRAASSNE
ncbi:hypothetical protein [Tatumella citrea]|uniref:Uncharacterized protein n=1 Tax=Tatumella citrea TaxID=53336 RepID=A0A1Y0LGP2_TATCI|nr:hypothetical protein [Tatumella citrea]ARU92781.1 hypothetical protein A7K98_02615 [Tatumella citrea]ARU96819.1 hypothetical protein A7K99_02615 [Tatumella citrea]